MGNRLSKIYTRTGDDGTTGLGTGDRIMKDSKRVEVFGTVDELNSVLGVVLSSGSLDADLVDCLTLIQRQLFDLGGEMCLPGTKVITTDAVTDLEKQLDKLNENLPPLKDFVLPGGSPVSASCHVARAVCRRAERRAWALARDEEVNEHSLMYLNRLSDLLFVIARELNRQAECEEPLWGQRK